MCFCGLLFCFYYTWMLGTLDFKGSKPWLAPLQFICSFRNPYLEQVSPIYWCHTSCFRRETFQNWNDPENFSGLISIHFHNWMNLLLWVRKNSPITKWILKGFRQNNLRRNLSNTLTSSDIFSIFVAPSPVLIQHFWLVKILQLKRLTNERTSYITSC